LSRSHLSWRGLAAPDHRLGNVLYSLSGTVGDANWFLADPTIAGIGSRELLENLSSVFQYNGGPGGLITIDFNGPTIFAYRSTESYSSFIITATCTNPSGCYTCSDVFCPLPGFSYAAQQVANV
jgi:hypothetical protein